MKKFSFSLDKVLSYKEQLLESAKSEHAAALARVHSQEDVLEAAWQRYREYNDEYCENKTRGMLVTEALMYQSGLRGQELTIQRETKKLEELRAVEEKKRNALVEAKKETSSLEKLREKKLEGYQKALQKSEEQFIEEFVSTARAMNGAEIKSTPAG